MGADGQVQQAEGRARPLDPFRDLEAMVDLIGVAFGERLDPAGAATLARMRRFARSGPLLQWAWALAGRATVAPGLVWVVDGRLVGNVSMRRARDPGGYLIGNVVVHPDQRGRGIASALMKQAIKVAQRRAARWVGLEVRADNEVARGLYEGLRFQEVGRTRHLLHAGAPRWDPSPPSGVMRRGRRRDGDELVQLMRLVIPKNQRPLLEVQEADYRPGWGRRLERWLRCEDEIWWVVEGDDGIDGAVRVGRKHGRFPDRMEILVRPGGPVGFEGDLVRRGIVSLRGSPGTTIEISLPETQDAVVAALEEAGFEEFRVLIQMKRTLTHRVPLRTA